MRSELHLLEKMALCHTHDEGIRATAKVSNSQKVARWKRTNNWQRSRCGGRVWGAFSCQVHSSREVGVLGRRSSPVAALRQLSWTARGSGGDLLGQSCTRRPPRTETREPGEWPHGRQFWACFVLDTHIRKNSMLTNRAASLQAHLRSHPDRDAGVEFSHAPTTTEYTVPPHLFTVLLLEPPLSRAARPTWKTLGSVHRLAASRRGHPRQNGCSHGCVVRQRPG